MNQLTEFTIATAKGDYRTAAEAARKLREAADNVEREGGEVQFRLRVVYRKPDNVKAKKDNQ